MHVRIKGRILLIMLPLAMSCVRAGFHGEGSPTDGAHDEATVDVAGSLIPDGARRDATVDVTGLLIPDGAISTATCDSVQLLVAPSQPTHTEGPALSPDGLRLYATRVEPVVVQVVTSRPNLSAPFGPWVTVSPPVGDANEDLTLFDHRAASYGIITSGTNPDRYLDLCPLDGDPAPPCRPLTIEGIVEGAAIDDANVDDASATVLGDRLLVLFNVVSSGRYIYQVDLTLTTAQGLDTVTWTGTPVPGLEAPFARHLQIGEAGLSQDGRLVVVMRKEDTIPDTDGGNLYLFARSDVDSSFGPPINLEVASDPLFDEGNPEIWATPEGMELYFDRTDSAATSRKIYHTRCQLR